MTKMHCFLGVSGLLAVTAVATMALPAPAAAAEEMTLYRRILSVDAGGSAVSFRAEDGKGTVKAKVVSGKTTLAQGPKGKMKDIQMSALKEGLVCEVTYAGDTASKIECEPEASE